MSVNSVAFRVSWMIISAIAQGTLQVIIRS